MLDKLEGLIKVALRSWKKDAAKPAEAHPDEEALAGFLDGRLGHAEAGVLQEHLLFCGQCMDAFALALGGEPGAAEVMPEELIRKAKALVPAGMAQAVLQICLLLKEKALELLATTGDVLVGQELMPAPVLRSREIREFKDEVNILKDFPDLRVEAKLENKGGKALSLRIAVKRRPTQELLKDLRVTLVRAGTELESYLSSSGAVTFEHVLAGKYRVEISSPQERLAVMELDIRA
jgi:hypothetical protein